MIPGHMTVLYVAAGAERMLKKVGYRERRTFMISRYKLSPSSWYTLDLLSSRFAVLFNFHDSFFKLPYHSNISNTSKKYLIFHMLGSKKNMSLQENSCHFHFLQT